MSDKFIVEIITPNSSIFKEEATEVIIPSYEGQMGILKDHIPLITFLRPGIISVKSKDEKKYFVEEGTVEFSNGNLLILTSAVKNINDLDKSFIEKIIKDCQDKMGNVEISDKEKYLLSHKIDTLREIN
jgi:F-type H+-transporting ATPase subunit epsilon/F-type H+-transporting ATPase subunit delta